MLYEGALADSAGARRAWCGRFAGGAAGRRGGATVIGTVRRGVEAATVRGDAVSHLVALDGPNPVTRIREIAPDGVDRIVEVALSANADVDVQVVAQGAVIAACASPADRPALPFWPLLFANVSLRLLDSDDLPTDVKQQAARGGIREPQGSGSGVNRRVVARRRPPVTAARR